MKNKVMRSVIFGMTTVECVKVFTSDAERAAETKTQEAADLFDACAREYVLQTELLAADLKGDIYVTDDEYKALDDKLRAEAAEKGFLSLSVFDDRGEHHSMETPYYGDSSEVTALLARTTGNSIVSVLRSESAGRRSDAYAVSFPRRRYSIRTKRRRCFPTIRRMPSSSGPTTATISVRARTTPTKRSACPFIITWFPLRAPRR